MKSWLTVPAELRINSAGFKAETRIWQGIPAIERTRKGRFFAVWYSGGEREPRPGNYAILAVSENGKDWLEPFALIVHPDFETSRVMDPGLWIDPLGRLWVFWCQSAGTDDDKALFWDKDMGVWAAVIDRPDCSLNDLKVKLRNAKPRRICDGLKLNKPTVLSDGRYAFCSDRFSLDPEKTYFYTSADNGATFEKTGEITLRENKFVSEPCLWEKRPGVLACWMRTALPGGVREALSADGGRTWTEAAPIPEVTGPHTRFAIQRLKSGRILFINHWNFTGRNNLCAFLSEDDGETWPHRLMLDDRNSVSYPDFTQGADDTVYAIYDRERDKTKEILMAVFNERDVIAGAFGAHSESKIIINKA